MQMWKMKRALSESDCDDVFSDEQSKDCSSPGDVESCGGGGLTRKRRRGIIEKRRRDRINNSLSELRRLVPAAFEKQGSAKLEKAEILQLTVDHLKTLHAKGLDALAYDPHKFAMDYHSIGFRECAAEVARYMVTVEGMDIQDPLRLRLMSHLQCFAAQRELANKQASNTWAFPPHVTNPYPAPPANSMSLAPPPVAAVSSSHPHGMLSHNSNPQATPTSSGFYDPSSSLAMNGYSHSSQLTNMDALGNPGCSSASAATNRLHQPQPHHHHQTPMAAVVASSATFTNVNPAVSTNSQYHVNLQAHPFQLTSNSYAPSTGKPYRPWGTELAY